MSRLLPIAFIFFCFEIGLFLVFVPWSDFWEYNVLLTYAPGLQPLALHQFVRSGVSGLGGIDILIGFIELKRFLQSSKTAPRIAK